MTETPVPILAGKATGTGTRAVWRAWWRAAPDNLRGSLLLLSALAIFSIMTVAIKSIGPHLPIAEVLLVRQAIMSLLLVPLFLGDPAGLIATRRPLLQILRGLFSLGAMTCFFTAVQFIPVAEATALSFTQVLFVTSAAVIILKERVDLRRWLATALGFAGALVMLRPGTESLGHFGWIALLGAVFGAGAMVTVRMFATGERTQTILFYQALVVVAVLGAPGWILWVRPSAREWALLGLVGISGTLGQYFITKAYQIGEAAALAPLDFARLLIAVAVGYIGFGEAPQATTSIGALILVAATLENLRHNRQGASANVALTPIGEPTEP